eukprot:3102036-Rhodomonas_salina.1
MVLAGYGRGNTLRALLTWCLKEGLARTSHTHTHTHTHTVTDRDKRQRLGQGERQGEKEPPASGLTLTSAIRAHCDRSLLLTASQQSSGPYAGAERSTR